MNKIWWVILFIVVATTTYFVRTRTIRAPESDSEWANPTTEPYVKGPSGPPPGSLNP